MTTPSLREKERHINWDIVARELKSPLGSFHEDLLQALQPSFMELAAKNSMILADQLQHFVGRHFPSANATYPRRILEQIQHMRMEVPTDQDAFLKQSSVISNQYISFLELKTALLMPAMISQRLAKHDPHALMPTLQNPIPRYDLPRSPMRIPEYARKIERPREFRANVHKRSRKWLAGPSRPRILIIKEDMVELFQKNDKKANKTITIDKIESLSASNLEFTVHVKGGDSLVLTCDTVATVRECVSELATHCLVHALDTGQPTSETIKLIACGAHVTGGPMRLPPTFQRTNALSFPTSLLGLAYIADEKSRLGRQDNTTHVQALLKAGAPVAHLLHWPFACTFFLRKSPLSRNILDYFLQLRLPLNTAADDAPAMSLLQYLCLMRNVSTIERFVQHISHAELTKCLKYVNGAGDSALHLAVKLDTDLEDAELVASLLIQAAAPKEQSSSTCEETSWVDAYDGSGDSVLLCALKAKMWKTADLLLSHLHASPMRTDKMGRTAVHVALMLDAPFPLQCRLIRACHSKRQLHGLDLRDADGKTPISIAIETRNEAAVVRLLECGAQPGETPLHVAIKTGLPTAAAALVQHGAAWNALDGNGSSPLSLALRYGLYALAYDLIQVMAGESVEWIDPHVGDSLVGLALKAGELELAALLLDLCPADIAHARTLETPLHHVMKLREWLDFVEPKATKKPGKMHRSRFKSKSDGDLSTLLVGDWISQSPHDMHLFVQRVLDGMLLGILKRVSPRISVLCPRRDPSIEPVIYHLVNTNDCMTDDQVDAFTPLHAAARGALSTNHILRWMLLHIADLPVSETIGVAVGPLGDSPLHDAITSLSSQNALDLLECLTGRENADAVVNAVRTDQASALHLACENPKTKLMQSVIAKLLALGAYTEGWNSIGQTPLHVAIEHGADASVIELLCSNGCDLNARTEDGRTPLMVALRANNDTAFVKLMQLGANRKAVVPITRLNLSQLAAAMETIHPVIANLLDRPQRPSIAANEALLVQPQQGGDQEMELRCSVAIQEEMELPELPSPPSKAACPEDEPSVAQPLTDKFWSKPIDQHLDHTLLARLKEEEKATLQLVALEAKHQAREWLLKRVGKQKLLADSLLIRQQYFAQHGRDLDAVHATAQAEKLFVERHMAEMVAEARLEIEREKQLLLYEAMRFKDHASSTSTFFESFISDSSSSVELTDFEPRKTLC
ncbi:unnamed protein product [Aphanomyces euteiches]